MYNIRRAEVKDIDTCLDLLVQVGKVHANIRPDLFIGGKTKYNREELKEIINDNDKPIFVYEENNIVYGYIFTEIKYSENREVLQKIKTLYIDDLCVDENKRGLSIGKALYLYALDYAKSINCHNITLHVWEGNDSAKAFYEKMGMTVQYTCLEAKL